MCLDPVSIAVIAGSVLSAAAAGIAGKMQTDNQNAAAQANFEYQKQQQQLTNKAAQDQFNETLSRQRLDNSRTAASEFEKAQASILENQRRQSLAITSASTAGLTGQPLNAIFNDYQSAVGNISTNLEQNYRQLQENSFFDSDNARRRAQSIMNQAQPQPLVKAGFSALPYILQGIGGAVSGVAANPGFSFTNPFGGGGGDFAKGTIAGFSPQV